MTLSPNPATNNPRAQATRQRTIQHALASPDLPNKYLLTHNIRTVLNEAVRNETREDLESYRDWYYTAQDEAYLLAHNTPGLTTAQAAGILAALSPGATYERSVDLAAELVRTGDCLHPYGDSINKARKIRNGAQPTDILRGRKVRSFYTNILYPSTAGPVTVDRHALALALNPPNQPPAPATRDQQSLLNKHGVYQYIAGAYRTATRQHNADNNTNTPLLPHEVQAVTWCYYRNQLQNSPTF